MHGRRQQLRQKTGSLLALLCVLVPLLYTIDFATERALHRLQMIRKAEQASLQTIVLDSASIEWKKKGRELLVNNEYFDVVSITYRQGKAYLQGVFDKRETAMHRAFEQAQKQPQNQGGPAKMVQWLLRQWIQPTLAYTMPFNGKPAAQSPNAKKAAMYHRYKQKPLHPPPRLLFIC